jgi:hypothetical protein
MFETARLALNKMTFDTEALQSLDKLMADAINQKYSTPEDFLGEDAISAGNLGHEAQTIAIQENVKLLQQKHNDDEVHYFLKNELHGRQIRRKQKSLTDEQTKLLNRLEILIDELEVYSYTSDTDTFEDQERLARERARAITERDELIGKIQDELAQPIDKPDKVASPQSSRRPIQSTPSIHQKPFSEEKPSTPEQPTTPSMPDEATKARQHKLKAIMEFRKLTGASLEDAEDILIQVDYNLVDAMNFYYDDQEAAEQPASPDPELEAALKMSLGEDASADTSTIKNRRTFTAIDEPSFNPIGVLEREAKLSAKRGNFERLKSMVQAEAKEDVQMGGEDAYERPPLTTTEFLYEKWKSTTGKKDKRKVEGLLVSEFQEHLSGCWSGSVESMAQEETSQDAQIDQVRQGWKKLLADTSKKLSKMQDGLKTMGRNKARQNVSRAGKNSPEKPTVAAIQNPRQEGNSAKTRTGKQKLGISVHSDYASQLKALESEGWRNLHVKFGNANGEEPVSPTVLETTETESFIGRSHSGECIPIDAHGNFIAPVTKETEKKAPPPESPWKAYRAMRSRLQVQYYGTEAWYDNPDPLRGVPTVERSDYIRPVRQARDNSTVSTEVDDEAQERIRIAAAVEAADAEQDASLTEEERRTRQEGLDHAYARLLAAQWEAEEAGRVADAADAWKEQGGWEGIQDAIARSKKQDATAGENAKDGNDSCHSNTSLEGNDHDTVLDDSFNELPPQPPRPDSKRRSSTDMVTHPEQEENKKGRFNPPPFVNLRDLEKKTSDMDVDEASLETKRNLFVSNEEDAWDGIDSDAEDMDIDDDDDDDDDYNDEDDEVLDSDADAQDDADDDNDMGGVEAEVNDAAPAFAPNGDKDVVMGAMTHDTQYMLKVPDGQEKKDSPMTFKPGEDADMDAEDSPEETEVRKADEKDDFDMGGGL